MKPMGIAGLAGPLEIPEYGYERNGQFYRPTIKETMVAFLRSINPLAPRRRWTNLLSFISIAHFSFGFVQFMFFEFQLMPLLAGFLFLWLIDLPLVEAIGHRGFNHGAFRPRSKFALLVLRLIGPIDMQDELFHISHTVHHQISDQPGDPFNAQSGLFNLQFTDFLHQHLRWDLTEREYQIVCARLKPFMLYQNSYRQFQRWGSVTHPVVYFLELCCRRLFRYFVIATVFGAQFLGYLSAVFIGNIVMRTMNYYIHGSGRNRHREGVEFHRDDRSYNHWALILLMGQRHNYHHQFPKSANTAFFRWHIDQSFIWIKFLEKLGLVVDVIDSKDAFMKVNFSEKSIAK